MPDSKIEVMIIDDDKMSVECLEEMIDWEEEGFRIVAKAFNGMQALKLFQKYRPQLVITDINMPLMDGIALARKLRVIDEEVRIILLTAYSEFEYAREAISERVDSYLIKTEVDEVVLKKKLNEIKKLIKGSATISSIVFQKALVDYIVLGEDHANQLYKDTNVERVLHQPYIYMVVQQDREVSICGERVECTPQLENLCFMGVPKLIRETPPELRVIQVGIISGNRTIILLSGEGEREYVLFQKIRQFGDRLKRRLKEEYKCSFSIFVAEREEILLRIIPMIRDERLSYRKAFLEGSGMVYGLRELDLVSRNYEETPIDASKMEAIIKKQQREHFALFIREWQIWALQNKISIELLVEDIKKIYQVFVDYCKQNPKLQMKASIWQTKSYYDLRSICQYFLELYDEMAKEIEGMSVTSPEVSRTLKYIHEHYHDSEIRIINIAQEIGISSSRISVLFKKETSKTIVQYITELRIEEAKRLLNEGRHKIYEVAEMVGYGNSKYLSLIFQRETGMQPTEYRKRIK